MPAERLSMRQIRDVLRLCWESRLPQRAAARSLGLGQGTVSSYLSRARAAGLAWPVCAPVSRIDVKVITRSPAVGDLVKFS